MSDGCAQVTAEYIRDLLATIATLTAERDAARAERDEAVANQIGVYIATDTTCDAAHKQGIAEGERRATAAIVAWLRDPKTATGFADDETLSEDRYVRVGLAVLVTDALADAIERGEVKG